jgi:hypothetical protein
MLRRLVLSLVVLVACTYNYDQLRGHPDGAADSIPPGSGGQAGIASGGKGGVGGANANGGHSGSGGAGGRGANGGGSGGGGQGGNLATGGEGGGSGGSNLDASCSLVNDASVDHSTTSCTSTFNFEGSGNLQGATLLGGSQAFKAISQGMTPNTYCGAGSLAIAATFSGTTGALTKGEVDIPLGGASGPANLSGKTLTVHVSASPAACGEDLRFKVNLNTSTGDPNVLDVNALTSNFATASVSLAAVTGASATNSLAIQAFSVSGYTGTIYVDEIDIPGIGLTGEGGTTGTGGSLGTGGTLGAGGATGTGGAAGSGSTGVGGATGNAGSSGSDPCAGFCTDPISVAPLTNSGDLGTGVGCYDVVGTLTANRFICGNFVAPRTFAVNGVSFDCVNGDGGALPPPVNGGYCMQVSAGDYDYAYFVTY